ncbi:hypothetical protein GJ496_012047 [Pomphorhynchus laevis]|nr:hypothetical protein GJ496_012047 [Pomphorhynchus laevis]
MQHTLCYLFVIIICSLLTYTSGITFGRGELHRVNLSHSLFPRDAFFERSFSVNSPLSFPKSDRNTDDLIEKTILGLTVSVFAIILITIAAVPIIICLCVICGMVYAKRIVAASHAV